MKDACAYFSSTQDLAMWNMKDQTHVRNVHLKSHYSAYAKKSFEMCSEQNQVIFLSEDQLMVERIGGRNWTVTFSCTVHS